MKFSIVTFGCRVNQSDSLRLEEDLRARGGGEPPHPRDADIVIVNTCSVTATRRPGRAPDHPPDRAREPAAPRSSRPAVMPRAARRTRGAAERRPRRSQRLTSSISTRSFGPSTAERFGGGDGPCGASIEPGMAGRTAFTLRVQTGCDQHCSYCIIPTTRGRGRSLPVAHVVSEATRVAEAGFKEIALTGVHLGSYGRDLDAPSSLFDLLCALATMMPTSPSGSVRSSRWIARPRSSIWLRSAADASRRIFTFRCSTRSDRMLKRCAVPTRSASIADLVDTHRRPAAARLDRHRHDRRIPRRDRRRISPRASTTWPRAPLSHVHVFPYSDRPGHRGVERWLRRCRGTSIRERGAAPCAAAASRLTKRFRAVAGRHRPSRADARGRHAGRDR